MLHVILPGSVFWFIAWRYLVSTLLCTTTTTHIQLLFFILYNNNIILCRIHTSHHDISYRLTLEEESAIALQQNRPMNVVWGNIYILFGATDAHFMLLIDRYSKRQNRKMYRKGSKREAQEESLVRRCCSKYTRRGMRRWRIYIADPVSLLLHRLLLWFSSNKTNKGWHKGK